MVCHHHKSVLDAEVLFMQCRVKLATKHFHLNLLEHNNNQEVCIMFYQPTYPQLITIRCDYKWACCSIGYLYKVILNFYFIFDTGKNIHNLIQDEKA